MGEGVAIRARRDYLEKALTARGPRGQSRNVAKARAKTRRSARDSKPRRPVLAPVDEGLRHGRSGTAVAAEALRTGILPATPRRPEIPTEDDAIRAGDPDDLALANEYGGEETPGGSSSTPDQNNVDDIGRVYGLQDEDNGPLRSGAEVLGRRDKHRSELRPPRRPGR